MKGNRHNLQWASWSEEAAWRNFCWDPKWDEWSDSGIMYLIQYCTENQRPAVMLYCERYLYIVIQLRHMMSSKFILKVNRLLVYSRSPLYSNVLCVVFFCLWYPLIFGTVRMLRSHRGVADHGLHCIQRYAHSS